MSGPYAIYEIFNWIEGIIWIGLAAFLLLKARPRTSRQRLSVLTAAFGLLAFASTDFLEARTHGDVPLWLWIYKIFCASLLLSCRFTYIGWRNLRWADRYVVFALICLAASVAIIVVSND